MIQENEVVTLVIGVGALVFIWINHVELKRLPAPRILIAAFHMFLAGWIMTVLEGFFWEGLLHTLEHICYAGSSILVAVWCWKVFQRKELRQ